MRLSLKTESFARIFFLISCLGLLIYAILAFYTFHTAYFSAYNFEIFEDNIQGFPNPEYTKNEKYDDLKYILVWTISNDTIDIITEGQTPFVEHKCSYTNCYFTTDKYILNDYTKFEAIVFDVKILQDWKVNNFPKYRSKQQKYIFHGLESSDNVPVCSVHANDFFNWTWSYKLDSDFVNPFIEVKDLAGNVIARKETVDWESNMTLPLEIYTETLKHKKKAMAWITKKCESKNNVIRYAKRLQAEFKKNLLVFDIYGCGQLDCPNEGCLEAIKRDYYFYFAPEYSNAEDYVTDEVVTAYSQYAVPIVTGGSDYRKFLPDGSYINAVSSTIDEIVALVEYIIRNPKIYYSFHRWRNHYVISKAEKNSRICKICEYLNDDSKFEDVSIKKSFRKWWNSGPLYERCFPKDSRSLSHLISYENNSRPVLQRKTSF